MILRSFTTRTAVAGAVTALAAGAMVGVATSPANAATVTNTYTCSLPSVYSGDFDLTVTGEIPVPQYWAGATVPAGLLTVTAEATVPADAAGLLGAAGVTGARSDNFGFALSTSTVPVPLKGDFVTEGGSTKWKATGANTAFTTPNPGTYDALMPAAFDMTTMQGDTDSVTLNCVLKEGTTAAAISSNFTLLKQSSKTVVTPTVIKVKKGKAAKIPATVSSTSLGGPVSGKVVAKEGTKTLKAARLKNGKVVLNLGTKLKLGKHRITVKYLGIPSVGGSSDKVVVKVVR
ncbi:Ig-like domain repeat protein [Nocardioides sp. T2.26MG-1]|uniref:Ig-like domain repeat protein n=1 Tax=Nocardioides sp. T2.26MG-1 TaxID=3041166 RepID=UPI00247741D6|nr:DUF6801 domain-containing protein [Nocardioides sp. T2.26MG-1]CAI9408433.1 hypothetical protein HIDPHFAB_01078 [Nocardioides sp. T2.26MG-1]